MKTFRFHAEIEPDEDGWFVRCPTMERYGAATWGETREKAQERIEEVLGLVLESMVELGMPIPDEDEDTGSPRGYLVSTTIHPEVKSTLESVKTYQFRVVVEHDEDQWFAYCPTLEDQGAATGGRTREEAYINIHQVLRMTLDSMISLGETIPAETAAPSDEIISIRV